MAIVKCDKCNFDVEYTLTNTTSKIKVECPNCGHKFEVDASALEYLKANMDRISSMIHRIIRCRKVEEKIVNNVLIQYYETVIFNNPWYTYDLLTYYLPRAAKAGIKFYKPVIIGEKSHLQEINMESYKDIFSDISKVQEICVKNDYVVSVGFPDKNGHYINLKYFPNRKEIVCSTNYENGFNPESIIKTMFNDFVIYDETELLLNYLRGLKVSTVQNLALLDLFFQMLMSDPEAFYNKHLLWLNKHFDYINEEYLIEKVLPNLLNNV